jgi:predicted ATPase
LCWNISPFSPAERTAFVGRETECSAIRAVIDRALSGQGSLTIRGGAAGRGKSRLAMEMAEYASRWLQCLVGHGYERDEPSPYLPFVEIIESSLEQAASLDDFSRRMGDNAAEFTQIAPSLRRFFPDIPQPLELPPAQKARLSFPERVRMAGARDSNTFVLVHTRGPSLGRRIDAGSFDSSGQSRRPAPGRYHWDLSG